VPNLNARGLRAAIALACCAVLFVSVNVAAQRWLRGARIDLTEQRVYTLSDGTRATLAKIDEPVTVRFYFSKRLGQEVPSYGAYARHVQEMLEEYALRAGEKIRLEIVDPLPYSPEEDRAVAFGIQGVPINAAGEQVYFGIAATNSTDDQQVIPFLHPERERFLEYDLTKLVHALAVPKKVQLGLISGLPLEGDMVAAAMQGVPVQPFAIMEQLQQLYDVRDIGGAIDRVPADIDVLMLVHPKGLSDAAQYAIDQYVLRGGKLLVFLDPLSEFEEHNPSPMNAPGSPHWSSLDRLMRSWGVAMDPTQVVADRLAARRVNAGSGADVRVTDYLGWLALRDRNFDHDSPITADLKVVNMASAGAIEPLGGARTQFEKLIFTSLSSMRMPAERFRGRPDPVGVLASFRPEGRSSALAGRVTGPADTAFPDGPPPPAEGAKPAAPQLKTSTQPIDVIVVGDTDLLADRFWVKLEKFFGRRAAEAVADNGDFVANAIDVLAGGPDLANLRSRGTVARPFEMVQGLQQAAEDRYAAQEHELQERLKDMRAKLRDLQGKDASGKQGGTIVLTADEARAIDGFRAEMLRTRQQLRGVQLALRQDIDRLRREVEIVDIAAVPLLVALGAIGLAVVRRRRNVSRLG
jgi:ABC-type uncharacterized transport system involved in gliding motility auxiliary subunit